MYEKFTREWNNHLNVTHCTLWLEIQHLRVRNLTSLNSALGSGVICNGLVVFLWPEKNFLCVKWIMQNMLLTQYSHTLMHVIQDLNNWIIPLGWPNNMHFLEHMYGGARTNNKSVKCSLCFIRNSVREKWITQILKTKRKEIRKNKKFVYHSLYCMSTNYNPFHFYLGASPEHTRIIQHSVIISRPLMTPLDTFN